MEALDLRGLVPAPVTPFTRDGEVDHAAIQRLGSWLGSFKGVKGLVVLGHAGEGTFLTPDEQTAVIESFVKSVDGKIPVIAGITLEGTKVAAQEAKRAVKAGAEAGLVYPSHGWLRFGYQKGAPQDRYRAIYQESGLPLILFQYPDATKATYNLETQLEIAAQPGVFAMKNGVRNMRRWDTEIPVVRRERPNLQILTCHDEYLLHTMFDVDGALVGYGGLAPEPLIETDRGRQGQGLREGTRDPRPAASGDPHRLSPRIAHGRNGRAQARPRRARHSRARDGSLSVAAPRAGRRGRDRGRAALRRSPAVPQSRGARAA